MIPLNAIITTTCLNMFANTESRPFSEIKAHVEMVTGPLGDGFLANALESLGYKVNGDVVNL